VEPPPSSHDASLLHDFNGDLDDSMIHSPDDTSESVAADEHNPDDDASYGDGTDWANTQLYYKRKRSRSWKDIWIIVRDAWWAWLTLVLLGLALLLCGLLIDTWAAMSWQAWVTIVVIVFTVVFLMLEWVPPSLVFTMAMGVLYLLNIVDDGGALAGFCNSGVMTVAIMFPIAKAIEKTHILLWFIRCFLGTPSTVLSAQLRLLPAVTVFSAFLNNTPIVAMMIPMVQQWCRQCDLPPSKLMMPLSFAAILGGCITIIGTSANLIVSGLAESSNIDVNLGFFKIGMVGAPAAAVGLLYLFTLGSWLLPSPKKDLAPVAQSNTTVDDPNDDVGSHHTDSSGQSLQNTVGAPPADGELKIKPVSDDECTHLLASASSSSSSSLRKDSVHSLASLSYDSVQINDQSEQQCIELVEEAQVQFSRQEALDEQQPSSSWPTTDRQWRAIVTITNKYQHRNRTLRQTGLYGVPNLDLERICVRDQFGFLGEPQLPDADLIVTPGSWLYFSGELSAIRYLMLQIGIVPATSEAGQVEASRLDKRLVQVVVNRQSPIVGCTLAEADFLGRYNAAVLAVHSQEPLLHDFPLGQIRLAASSHDHQASHAHSHHLRRHRHSGEQHAINRNHRSDNDHDDQDDAPSASADHLERIPAAAPAATALHLDRYSAHRVAAGDTFLLETTKDFLRLYENHRDFALVSLLEEESILPRRLSLRMLVSVVLVGVMIAEATASVAPLSALAMVTICVLVLMDVLTWQQALSSVNGEVLIVIAAAFALGNAMTDTNAATVIAESLLDVFEVAGDIGVLFGLYLITALMSAVISNAATVTLMFPIAIQFSQQTTLSYQSVLFTLMLAGSASFATPVGYQTNLMVMDPGGYRAVDYLRVGLPLTVVEMTVSVVLVYFIF